MSVVVTSQYTWNLVVALVMCLQCFFIGTSITPMRFKIFNKEFFEKNFPELKGNYPKGGYPDMGSGRYSQKLSPEKWKEFNNAQRAHYNYIEGLPLAIFVELFSGLYYPKYAVWIGIAYIIGRALYTGGYKLKGPLSSFRIGGVIIIDLSLVLMTGLCFYGAFHAGGGLQGIKDLFIL